MSLIRRFNYTGRHKIPRNWINLELRRLKGSNIEVNFSIEMEAIKEKFPDLPGNSLILLEPYYKSESWTRIPCGTVDEPQFLSWHQLENHLWEDSLNFNVKIVSADEGPAKILAWNQGMRAEEADENGQKHRSLIDVVPRTDLGKRFWKLEWNGDYPELHVNAEFDLDGTHVKEIIRTDRGCHTVVYPLIVEQVLYGLLVERADTYDLGDDSTGWIEFASERLNAGPPPDVTIEDVVPDELKSWIADAVERFCQFQDLKSTFENHWIASVQNND